MSSTFTPSRLTIARERRCLSKVELAIQIGVSPRMILNYESGSKSPSPKTIEDMSRVLNFPPEFFTASSIESIDPRGASFRSLSSVTAKPRDAVTSAAALAIEINRQMEARFKGLPAPNLPDLRDASPDAAAASLRAHWQLGVLSINNVLHLLEKHGVRVFSLSGENAGFIDGVSFWANGTPFVFLNPNRTGEQARFDACHELAHLVLHRHGDPSGRLAEDEANEFARSFLMPAEAVTAMAPDLPCLESLLKLQKTWKVAVSTLARRLRDLGLITKWEYESLSVDIGERGSRVDGAALLPREQSLLLKKVFSGLRRRPGAKAEFAAELCISVEELDAFVYGLVPTLIDGGGGPSRTRQPAKLRLLA